jgi:hypothetical protein
MAGGSEYRHAPSGLGSAGSGHVRAGSLDTRPTNCLFCRSRGDGIRLQRHPSHHRTIALPHTHARQLNRTTRIANITPLEHQYPLSDDHVARARPLLRAAAARGQFPPAHASHCTRILTHSI